MRGPLEIAVAGAGPAGLATALLMHRLGHRVRIFERFEAPRPLGSGLILQPTGLAVLHDLGLAGEIAALGAPIVRLTGTDARTGRRVLDVRYATLRRSGAGLGVHRAALFGVLHDAVRARGIEVVTGSQVTGLDRDGGNRPVLLAGTRRLGAFDLVVDGMGSGSPLRDAPPGADPTRALAFGALWATVPWVAAGFDANGLLQRYRRASTMVGVLPIGRVRPDGPALTAFFWSLKADGYPALRDRGLDAWKAEVLDVWPETAPHLDAIASFEDLTLARYGHHTARTPAAPGLAVVGDSAHATSPQLGQGANMALLDARALFVALRDAPDLPQALELYCRLRRWHVRLYQALSGALTPFYQSDSRVLPILRDLAVAPMSRIPPGPQFLAAMVSGRLLNPIRSLGLDPAPVIQVGTSGQT